MKEITTQVFQDALAPMDEVLTTAIAQVKQAYRPDYPQARDFTAEYVGAYPGDHTGRWLDIRVTFSP